MRSFSHMRLARSQLVMVLFTLMGGFSVLAAAEPVPQTLPTEVVTLQTARGSVAFSTMIAATDATREKGLMFRRQMADHEAMIFDFPASRPVSFWMHNTALALDIIFIGIDGRVLNIAASAKPFDDTPLPSAGAVRAVLEIKAGLSERLGIRVGDRVTDERIFPR